MSKQKHEEWVNSLSPADLPKVAGILLAIVVYSSAQGFTKQLTTGTGHTFTVVSRRSPQQAHRRLLARAKRTLGKE